MKTKMYRLILFSLLLAAGTSSLFAAGSVTLTTTAVAAAPIFQGTNTNIVYITKMAVSGADVTTNNIQFTLSGTHDANDLSFVSVYFNPSTPTISGASFLGQSAATFAAPHTYSINIFRTLAMGSSGYFIITVNVSASATDNKTVRIAGSTDPVVFGFTAAVSVTNNQNNGGGLQTIQAADVTLTTSPVAAATLFQGTNTNIVYVTKMKVVTADVSVSNIQFTLSGTHDADDLTFVSVYFNPSAPTISGASFLGQSAAGFAAPHTYSINIFRTLAAASEGYFIITVNVSATATDNKTVRITGATTPVVFGYTTAPTVTNSQTNGGGLQTIQAADVTLTTSPVAAATLFQGTNTNIIYTAKMSVSTADVSVNNIQFTLSGNHDADDLTFVSVYFNPSTPTISGASFLGQATANFAAPHTYSINIFRTLPAGSIGYFLITVNVSATATDNKTVRIIGNTNPVVFGYTTAPNIINSQTNGGGLQTIQAPDITLTTSAVAAGTLYQGTNTNIIYVAKMNVATADVSVNNIQFTLSGNHDADDLTFVSVYFNPSSPTISGASFLGQSAAAFAAPHTYSINIFRTLAAATSGYFIITVNVSPTATDNKTVRITGSTTPVVFGYTTAPNVTNNQNNSGGLQTIQAADITLTSSSVAAGNIARGSNTNIVYVTKMNVTTSDISVNNIQLPLSGTHDADDLTFVSVYFNPSAPTISGASFLGQSAAGFAAPHTYSINIFRTLAMGSSGYFIITVNVSSTASVGKTVKVNGATDPVLFGYTTAPNVTNSQTNAAGIKTITATAKAALPGEPGNMLITAVTVYPNPATNIVFAEFISGTKGQASIQLTSESGKVVSAKACTIEKGNNKISMDVQAVFNGVYYITIQSGVQSIRLDHTVLVKH